MDRMIVWVFLFCLLSVGNAVTIAGSQPEQVHIAIGNNGRDMVVTWVTQNATASSMVEYGTIDITMTTNGSSSVFVDGGNEKRHFWIHTVQLKGLQPDTRYFYHCGSNLGWSDILTFKTWKEGNQWPVKVAMYGDLGAVNAQSLARLQQDVVHGLYDAIIHVGDFAYNLEYENARLGDDFMRQLEPVAGYVPYMTCPGNHEEAYNFSNYKARFTMPNYDMSENMFYSWDMGLVHFISINTEAYYFLNYGHDPLFTQWKWLLRDLEEATKPEARSEHPWIIVYGHRPMYCSNHDGNRDCHNLTDLIRVGIDGEFGMEDLLYDYGVDVAVWAHQHSYERMFPLYNYTVLNGSTEHPYTNPGGPVHFTTGSAGCREDHAPFAGEKPQWSAFRSVDYGYTRLTVQNETHLYFEQVSDDKDGEIIDSIWLIRDKHGPYPKTGSI